MVIEEILADLCKIEIPLPRNPLKAINSYLIRGQGRFLIVDTGMNREECMKVMYDSLRELGVDLKRTDFFITHVHADHLGLVSSLATETSTIYFNQPDASIANDDSHWKRVADFAKTSGFSEAEIRMALDNHPGRKYSPKRQLDFCILKEGDAITIGDYLFKCVETPGHTKGHTCLYEPNKKILISGDHILEDITPNISLWSADGNPLEEYLTSLDKIYAFDISLVLPGHRWPFTDHRRRIRELRRHHQARADEILSILEKGGQNAVQIASQMSWDMPYTSWKEFPIQQKWFATGEAISHLRYLEENGKITREMGGQWALFSLRRDT